MQSCVGESTMKLFDEIAPLIARSKGLAEVEKLLGPEVASARKLGGGRASYKWNGLCLKVARNEGGRQQSKKEVETFRNCKAFLPILAWTSDFKCILQPWATTMDKKTAMKLISICIRDGLPEHLKPLREYWQANPGKVLPSETTNPENWGVVDGKLYLLDYGMDAEVKDRFWKGLDENVLDRPF